MATGVKTTRWAPPMLATVVNNTLTPFAGMTVQAEAGTRTIRSAHVYVTAMDIVTATGGTITEWRVAAQVDAVGASTITDLDDIVHTGENTAVTIGPIDFTSYFATNFTGTSHTITISVYFSQSTGTTLNMVNVTAQLFLTYEYDDTQATQYQTVVIPLESRVGAEGTTLSQNGTNQVPQLTGAGGLLENIAGVSVLDYYFFIEGSEHGGTAVTDWTLGVRLDAEAEVPFSLTEKFGGSNRFICYLWSRKASVPTLTTTHEFHSRTAGLAAFNHAVINMVVTFSWTLAGSTSKLVSIQLPFELATPVGSTTSADASRFQREILIPEASCTLQQSAVRLNWNCAASVTPRMAVGGQAFRSYTDNVSLLSGMDNLQQRIDSGGAQGAGITLSPGANTITIDAFTTVANSMSNVSGLITLNYTCPLDASPAKHPQTIHQFLLVYDSLPATMRTATFSYTPPLSPYWLTGFCFWITAHNIVAINSVGLTIEILAGEAEGDGWRGAYVDQILTDPEVGDTHIFSRAGDLYRRHAGDPDSSRVNIASSRVVRLFFNSTTRTGMSVFYTLHGFSHTWSGTATPNPGAGHEVRLYRSDTNEHLYTTTTDAGGAYSFSVTNNNLTYYAEMRQSSTRYGRSDALAPGAGSGRDIDLDPTGPGGGGGLAHQTVGSMIVRPA